MNVHLHSLQIRAQKLQFAQDVAENYARPYNTEPVLMPEHMAEAEPPQAYPTMNAESSRNSHNTAPLVMTSEERDLLYSEVASPAEGDFDLEARLEEEFEQRRLEALAHDYGMRDIGGFVEAMNGSAQNDEYEDNNDDYISETGAPHFTASRGKESNRYYPYANKTECLLDVIDNFPNLRLSSPQLRVIMWAMKNCNPADVPNYDRFRAVQAQFREAIGVKTIRCVSDLGNVFYVNDVRDIISRDFQNPETASQLRFYPEETDGEMSEVWHGQRWREYPLDMLTPGYESDRGKRYYVNELAQLCDGRLVIPYIWVTYKGKVHGRFYQVTQGPAGLSVDQSTDIRLDADLLCNNYSDILKLYKGELRFSEHSRKFGEAMPNPCRAQCEDEDLFTIWMPLWADDVSGARSKQYQKHVNVYMVNSNLPGKLVQQSYFVHFVSASQEASAPEILGAVGKLVEETHIEPVRCYDARKHRPCRFRILVPNLQGDNPQQSEECSHIGHNGLYFCRICDMGGPAEVRESNEGYHALYEIGSPRTVEKTKASIKEQVRLASFGVAAPVQRLSTTDGTKDKIAQHWIDLMLERARALKVSNPALSTNEISAQVLQWLATQTKTPYNPILDMKYLDPSRDTPVEVLHTILLGDEKYAWHNLHTSWTQDQQNVFATRLRSTDTNGLLIQPIRASYMMQYRNGLVGKHFKTLMQVSTFHLRDLASPAQLALCRSLGELGAVLWIAEIDNLDSYLADLTILIDNVLDAFAALEPSKILVKIKLHLLKHLPDHIRRFGPAVRFATEVFESFNSIFRASSVLSNHQAPSRDIARKNVDLDRVKHLLSGGYWWDSETRLWLHAGDGVSSLLQQLPVIQRHLGWSPPTTTTPGSVRCRGKEERAAAVQLAQNTRAMEALRQSGDRSLLPEDDFRMYSAIEAIARSGDVCPVGSWVVMRINEDDHFIGHIVEIITPVDAQTSTSGIVTVEKFVVSSEKHHYLGMPILSRPSLAAPTLIAARTEHIQFIFNVQHDCGAAGCTPTGKRRRRVEREVSNLVETVMEHTDEPKYIINTHALHNASRLRNYLPRELTAPVPIIPSPDRTAHHHSIAAALRPVRSDKREKTRAKAAETRENLKKNAQDSSSRPLQLPGPDDDSSTRKRRRGNNEGAVITGEDACS